MNSFKHYRTVVFILYAILVFLCSNIFGADYEFEISCPYWYILFNRAGYVDYTKWYPSERHGYGPHEMCTGDIAGAVWYQNISTGSQSAWLVNHFIYPEFYPTTPFVMGGKSVWNSSCNPVWTDPCQPTGYVGGTQTYVPGLPYGDAAWSEVNDVVNGGKLQVNIHYEVVDLGEQDTNGVGGSPIAFRDPNGNPVYVYSERYVLLLTYVFKNVGASDINDLEFYQMMHGHPADLTYGTNCMYESTDYYDSLTNYTPCDSNHQTGNNFRYDITLWNDGDSETEHVDWMSFSSTIEPNAFDCNTFTAQGYGMEYNVTHRALQGLTELHGNELAGAMKWNIGNLSPGQTKSITLALMYGAGPIHTTPPELDCVTLTKTDNIGEGNCVEPSYWQIDSDVNYTIRYSTTCDINDVNIIDTLPDPNYADFNSCTGGGVYDINTHTVKWNLGKLDANDSNCFTLKVRVAEDAPQGNYLTNTVKMFSGSTIIKTATERTTVCCMDNKVYVDACAPPGGSGQSWESAYNNLQTALVNVRAGQHGCADQIWVAAGTYKPTEANDTNPSGKTFEMIPGENMFGHFAGNETSISQRNLADSNNETILSGDVDDDNDNGDVYYVVTAADANFDGFTIKKSTQRGISCSACSPTIENCVFKNNNLYGIYCDSGAQMIITNTFVNNNGYYGIYCEDSGTQVDIDRCTVVSNSAVGLCLAGGAAVNAVDSVFSQTISGIGIHADYSSVLFVDRCDISDNGSIGIKCSNNARAVIKRCYIQRNTGYGLSMNDSNEVESTLNIISDNRSANGVSIDGASDKCSLRNNLIYSNTFSGIYVCNSSEIRNNTIVDNGSYGIESYGGDPNVNSNIIWGNVGGSFDGSFSNVNYNCIQNYTGGGIGNRTDNPEFLDVDANDYHLTDDSNCIDAGDPNFADFNEVDMDGEDRIMDGNSDDILRVDMGADEFWRFDMKLDGIINFFDFAVFTPVWMKSAGQAGYNDRFDFYNDGKIDYKDLALFCSHWLDISDWYDFGGEGAYFAETFGEGGEMMAMQQPEQEAAEMMMELPEDEQQPMMAGEGETAAVYLISDVNEPNSGDEVTVQIYTDTPLFCMGLIITVTGDANITGAVSTADCNEYGWDPDWPTDPYIDPEGWLYVSGVSWEGQAEGVVGYLKFLYNSGEVSVSITEGDAFDAYCEPALISGEILTFGADPNES